MQTENMYGPLCSENNMAGVDFQMNKRKRNNTGQNEVNRVSDFLKSSSDHKLNYIFEELRCVRVSQEQTNRGMFEFQQGCKRLTEKLGQSIKVTNSDTNLLETLAYRLVNIKLAPEIQNVPLS